MKKTIYRLPDDFDFPIPTTIGKYVEHFANHLGINSIYLYENYIPYAVKCVQGNSVYKYVFLIFLPKIIMNFKPYLYTYYINLIIKELKEMNIDKNYKIHSIRPKLELFVPVKIINNKYYSFRKLHDSIFIFKDYDKKYPNIRSFI